MPSQFDFIKGELLLIDKPLDWTSFDAVNKVRRLLTRQLGMKLKVGHAGTLDPKASGLLLICTGSMTKQIESFMGLEKEYTGTFTLGAITPSYDTETEVSQISDFRFLIAEVIHEATEKFKGNLLQVPPQYSAKKIDGKRAYKYARKDREVEIPAVPVTISTFDITRIALPEVDFIVKCSKGTYIRSLARDFGEELGVGAYLSALRRTKIGEYDVKDALSMEQFGALLETMKISG
jgi:tRNA pseudouridine55 synthase